MYPSVVVTLRGTANVSCVSDLVIDSKDPPKALELLLLACPAEADGSALCIDDWRGGCGGSRDLARLSLAESGSARDAV